MTTLTYSTQEVIENVVNLVANKIERYAILGVTPNPKYLDDIPSSLQEQAYLELSAEEVLDVRYNNQGQGYGYFVITRKF